MTQYQLSPCSPVLDCPSIAGCRSSGIFAAIHVVPKIALETMVSWVLSPNNLVGPLSFQLERSQAGHVLADDWTVVTPLKSEISHAIDYSGRPAGYFQRTYYRVMVRDATGRVVRSEPVSANQGRLNQSQERHYREILRREQKRYQLKNTPSTAGYLLKVKYHGDRCRACIDPDSGESTNPACSNCFGIGFIKGYYPAYPCFNVDLGPMPEHLSLYQEQGPTVAGGVCGIRYLNIPPVHPWDVWVDATTDYRYVIGQIKPITVFGSLNLVCEAAAGRLPFDHPVYNIKV